MLNHEKDYLEQSAQFWERFRLYNENERREITKEVHRWAAIYNRYKLTQKAWQSMFERQNGCCAICGISQDDLGYMLVIDYDHVTGKVRGLLCRKCNCGIGMFGEDVENINKAIRYLEKS